MNINECQECMFKKKIVSYDIIIVFEFRPRFASRVQFSSDRQRQMGDGQTDRYIESDCAVHVGEYPYDFVINQFCKSDKI